MKLLSKPCLLRIYPALILWITLLFVLSDQQPCGPEPFWLNVTSEKKVLTSPGWNKGIYPPNLYCVYNYNITPGKYVLVTFTNFQLQGDVNCKKDFLELTINGMGARSYRYCGDVLPLRTVMFADYYPQMLFQTDNSTGNRGFRMTYQMIDTDQICKNDEITCENMKCVKKSLLCNGKDDCGDGTDEEHCPANNVQSPICGMPKAEPATLHPGSLGVYGGDTALPCTWPWQVSLQSKDVHPGGHQCGGTLINKQWVVTAGHCVSNYLKLRVMLGNHNQLSREPGEQIRYDAEQFAHPQFNPFELENDIALIKLNAPIAITDMVQPICLPKANWKPAEGTVCYATGWGRNSTTDDQNVPNLQQVPVPISNFDACKEKFPRFITDKNICTGYKAGGHNPCYGDSGGPLVTKKEGNWTLVGVVSFGSKVCGEADPTVYTLVSKYLDWINEIIRNNP